MVSKKLTGEGDERNAKKICARFMYESKRILQ